MAYTNRIFTWDFDALKRFYEKYIVKWLNSAVSWTEAQKKQARANLGLGDGSIDSEPTFGSNNIVTSGGVYSEINKDKVYNPLVYSGLGRKVLRKNIVDSVNVLTQSMINDDNTIYVIQYDFDLGGETITIPEGCVLEFDGGSLRNGTLVGANTKIVDTTTTIFLNVTLQGTWNIPYIRIENFGVNSTNTTDVNDVFVQNCVISVNNINVTLISEQHETYLFSTPIIFNGLYDILLKCTLCYDGEVAAIAVTVGSSTASKYRNYSLIVSQNNIIEYESTEEEGYYVIPENYGIAFRNIQNSIIYAESHMFAYGVLILSDSGVGFVNNKLKLYSGRRHACGIILRSLDTGWVNENLFECCHCQKGSNNPLINQTVGIFIDAEYSNSSNNNVFIKPNVEGHNTAVKFCGARNNLFVSIRTENCNNVSITEDVNKSSYDNVVLCYSESEGETNILSGYAMPISALGRSSLYEVFTIKGPERFSYVLNNKTYKQSSVVTRKIDDTDQANVVTDDGTIVYGHILKTDKVKTFLIETDDPNPDKAGINIKILDSSNVAQPISSLNSVVDYSFGLIAKTKYLRSGYGGKSVKLKFAESVTRVFIGMDSSCTNMNVYTTSKFTDIIDDKNYGKSLTYPPDVSTNVKRGFTMLYNDKLAVFSIGTHTNNGWVYQDGTPLGYTQIVEDSKISKFDNGSKYSSSIVTARPGNYKIKTYATTNPRYGHILDISSYKSFYIITDARFVIMGLDADNNLVTTQTLDDMFASYTGAYTITSGVAYSSSSTVASKVTFKDDAPFNRVFIGVAEGATFLKLYVFDHVGNAKPEDILDEASVYNTIEFIPTNVTNTPYGYTTRYLNNGVYTTLYWTGSEWLQSSAQFQPIS